MSRLRPETLDSNKPQTFNERRTFEIIYHAVMKRSGLGEGKLRDNGSTCALGALWDEYPRVVVASDLMEEVAAVNDSVPYMTKRQRRAHVLLWLRWKLDRLGAHGIRGPRYPKEKS